MRYAAAMTFTFCLAAALSVCCYIFYLLTSFDLLLIPIGITFGWSLVLLFSSNQTAKQFTQRELDLLHAANHDPLTGLLNRNGYEELINTMIANCTACQTSFGLIYVDLDDFKQVNDTYGHFIGDKVLAEVSDKLKDLVRQKDFVARLGGDEFVVIIPTNGVEAASSAAESVYARVADLASGFNLTCIPHKLTASVGVTVYPTDGPDLLTYADQAMYAAKKSGKSKFVFYSKNPPTTL